MSVIIVAACLYRQQFVILNEDVIWLIVAAGRLLDGGRFGTDVFEINTPPAVLLYMPAALLSRGLHLSMALSHHLAASSIAIGAICSMTYILRPILTAQNAARWLWPLGEAAFIFFCLQAYHFGQRDSLVIMLLLPLVALQAVLSRGEQSPARAQILVGVLAAFAIAVKPHYATVIATLWGLRIWQFGLIRTLNATDVRAAILAGGIILVGCLLLFPEWLDMVQLAWRYYRPTSTSTLTLLTGIVAERWSIIAVLGIGFLAWLRLPRSAPLRPLMTALLVVEPGLMLTYLLQSRGYAYQFVPFEVVAELLGFLAVVTILLRKFGGEGAPLVVSAALAGFVPFVAVAAISYEVSPADVAQNPVVATIAQYDSGNGMIVFDAGSMPAIYATALYGTKIAYRAQAVWALPVMIEAATDGHDPHVGDAIRDAQAFEANLIDNFRRQQPDVVVVNQLLRLADGLDIPSHLAQNPEFARMWAGYRLTNTATTDGKTFAIYARNRE